MKPTHSSLELSQLKQQARQFDEKDPLASIIAHFELPKDVIYLDGNSLGPLTKSAKQRALEVVNQQWGKDLIGSWNTHNWIKLPSIIGNKIAPIIGAQQDSVICCDSISVNLFKLLTCALHISKTSHGSASSKRNLVLSQNDNFPSDLYMVQGLSELLGEQQCSLLSVDATDIASTIEQRGNEIAVLMLTHVNFKNGDIHDMQALTKLAQNAGILVIWDLAHSAGVLPLELAACDVDFAVGCTYKYLNGGPGAPGFAYVSPKHFAQLKQPLCGWMGHKRPFAFDHDYEPASGIEQVLGGTPSIISMSVLDAALSIYDGVSMHAVREKSLGLNQFFQTCVDALVFGQDFNVDDFELACNTDSTLRGSQISFSHPQAYEICQALIAQNVIADFRAPNVLRIGFSPLFLSFENILDAAIVLHEVLANKDYMQSQFAIKQAVT